MYENSCAGWGPWGVPRGPHIDPPSWEETLRSGYGCHSRMGVRLPGS